MTKCRTWAVSKSTGNRTNYRGSHTEQIPRLLELEGVTVNPIIEPAANPKIEGISPINIIPVPTIPCPKSVIMIDSSL